MYWICALILFAVLAGYTIHKKGEWRFVILPVLIGLLLSVLLVGIDYLVKTTDIEVWSGRVIGWEHVEEWDEWHPPVTTCTTDSKGRQSCTTRPGYYEHHYAENYIKTTDNGKFKVNRAPDGTKFNDKYPNTTDELKKYWPYGTPSASTHTYQNKVQASYSIYKHENINIKNYPDLPDYPKDVHDYIHIDRILGDVPNKKAALKALAEANSELNKFIPDPEKEGKMKSWKEVNLIFVNVGLNKPIEYGYALQDKWEGGNKNDFVISFSLDENNNILWVYPFSWSEVEILKIEIRDWLLDQKQITDFVPVVNKVSQMVADKFERKEFADFNYLQIEVSSWVNITIVIFHIIIAIAAIIAQNNYLLEHRSYWYRY